MSLAAAEGAGALAVMNSPGRGEGHPRQVDEETFLHQGETEVEKEIEEGGHDMMIGETGQKVGVAHGPQRNSIMTIIEGIETKVETGDDRGHHHAPARVLTTER
jgi:hypothetical protein